MIVISNGISQVNIMSDGFTNENYYEILGVSNPANNLKDMKTYSDYTLEEMK